MVYRAALSVKNGPVPASPGLRAQTLKCVNTLSGHHSGIRVIAVATTRVYTGSYDNTIKVWNLDNGRCEATLEGHVAWIRSLFVHAREALLFSGSDDGIIKIWRADSFVHVHDINPADGDRSETGVLALTVDYDHNWCADPLVATCHASLVLASLPWRCQADRGVVRL